MNSCFGYKLTGSANKAHQCLDQTKADELNKAISFAQLSTLKYITWQGLPDETCLSTLLPSFYSDVKLKWIKKQTTRDPFNLTNFEGIS